jgi:hypothetical protein
MLYQPADRLVFCCKPSVGLLAKNDPISRGGPSLNQIVVYVPLPSSDAVAVVSGDVLAACLPQAARVQAHYQ